MATLTGRVTHNAQRSHDLSQDCLRRACVLSDMDCLVLPGRSSLIISLWRLLPDCDLKAGIWRLVEFSQKKNWLQLQ